MIPHRWADIVDRAVADSPRAVTVDWCRSYVRFESASGAVQYEVRESPSEPGTLVLRRTRSKRFTSWSRVLRGDFPYEETPYPDFNALLAKIRRI